MYLHLHMYSMLIISNLFTLIHVHVYVCIHIIHYACTCTYMYVLVLYVSCSFTSLSQRHLQSNRDEYIALMKGFLSEEEWPEIVEEAAPDYQPPDGQPLGLRTVHIFALANVLHRPIILLDSLAGKATCTCIWFQK